MRETNKGEQNITVDILKPESDLQPESDLKSESDLNSESDAKTESEENKTETSDEAEDNKTETSDEVKESNGETSDEEGFAGLHVAPSAPDDDLDSASVYFSDFDEDDSNGTSSTLAAISWQMILEWSRIKTMFSARLFQGLLWLLRVLLP